MNQPEWERSPLRLNLIEDALKRASVSHSEIRYHPQTTSTNEIAREMIDDGKSNFVVITDYQSAGKGRLNRIWDASNESSILLSLVLQLKGINNLGWLNLWAATVARSVLVENFNLEVALKWPNDLVIAEADSYLKFGGILSQSYKNQVIFGIGINYSQEQSELPIAAATSLKLQKVAFVSRETLIADLIVRFFTSWKVDANSDSFPSKAIIREYQAASYTLGKSVRVNLPNGKEIAGWAVALAENGALLVRNENGEVETITAGDVI